MCTVDIKVDEKALQGYNSELSSVEAISKWAQELVDGKIAEMRVIHEKQFVEVDVNSL